MHVREVTLNNMQLAFMHVRNHSTSHHTLLLGFLYMNTSYSVEDSTNFEMNTMLTDFTIVCNSSRSMMKQQLDNVALDFCFIQCHDQFSSAFGLKIYSQPIK